MKTKHLVPILVSIWGALAARALWLRFFKPAPNLLPVVRVQPEPRVLLPWPTHIESACEFARENCCLARIELGGVELLIGPDEDAAAVLSRFYRIREEKACDARERGEVPSPAGPLA